MSCFWKIGYNVTVGKYLNLKVKKIGITWSDQAGSTNVTCFQHHIYLMKTMYSHVFILPSLNDLSWDSPFWLKTHGLTVHCVKSAQIRTRNNSIFGHFSRSGKVQNPHAKLTSDTFFFPLLNEGYLRVFEIKENPN